MSLWNVILWVFQWEKEWKLLTDYSDDEAEE